MSNHAEGSRWPRIMRAALLFLVLPAIVVLAVVTAPRMRPVVPRDEATAWLLTAGIPGTLIRANGLIATPAPQWAETIGVVAEPGDPVTVVHGRDRVVVTDERHSTATIVDTATLASRTLPVNSEIGEVLAGDDDLYRVVPQTGSYQPLDPVTLAPSGTVQTMNASVRWTVASGTLWLAASATGTVTGVHGGRASPEDVFPPGHELYLAPTDDGVAAYDATDPAIAVMRDDSVVRRQKLPDFPPQENRFSMSPDGRTVALVTGSAPTRLLTTDLDIGSHTSTLLENIGADVLAPVVTNHAVVVADGATGTIVVIPEGSTDNPQPLPLAQPGRADGSRSLELFRSGEIVWANDIDGSKAYAVVDGVARLIVKRPHALPSAAASTLPSTPPSPPPSARPTSSQPPRTPRTPSPTPERTFRSPKPPPPACTPPMSFKVLNPDDTGSHPITRVKICHAPPPTSVYWITARARTSGPDNPWYYYPKARYDGPWGVVRDVTVTLADDAEDGSKREFCLVTVGAGDPDDWMAARLRTDGSTDDNYEARKDPPGSLRCLNGWIPSTK